jgi:hypothetical protein
VAIGDDAGGGEGAFGGDGGMNFDKQTEASRLKAAHSMRLQTNQPSDPSPWALMRLLSAAAGLRVFVFAK